ncbi:MAG: hypothetical protein IJD22_04465 [Clostridia bacterium]|nr:hypothetical protein [Clostridia bacterium]
MGYTFKRGKSSRLRRVSLKHCAADMLLIYRLTEEKSSDGYGPVFSLTVTKIQGGGHKKESVHLQDISRNSSEALRIFATVSRALVTPMCAAEIVSDIIGAYAY